MFFFLLFMGQLSGFLTEGSSQRPNGGCNKGGAAAITAARLRLAKMLFRLSAGEGSHAMIHEFGSTLLIASKAPPFGSTLLIVLLDMQHFQF